MLDGSLIRCACLTVHVTSVIFSASVNCPSLYKETAMEKQSKCPWCGHERCPDCQKDKWSELHDGCCQCRAKITQALDSKLIVKETPRLYGPGLRLVRPAASPFGR